MPQGAVYVGRPTKWGNLWIVGLAKCGCRSAGECEASLDLMDSSPETALLHLVEIAKQLKATDMFLRKNLEADPNAQMKAPR